MSRTEKKKKSNPIIIVLMIFFAGLFVFSGYNLVTGLLAYRVNELEYNDVGNEILEAPNEDFVPEAFKIWDTSDEDSDREPPRAIPTVDFKALLKKNSAAMAWLFNPNSAINYPVVMSTDNAYYLNHSLTGTENKGGCPFADCRNSADFTDKNTIIYGHHMRNGAMFTSLENYIKQSYYKNHPVVFMTTAEGRFKLEVFSAYVTEATSDAYRLNFKAEGSFAEWLKTITKRSKIKTNVKVTANDNIVTLSTCAYSFDNARTVVHCVIRPCPDEEWIYYLAP